MFRRFQIEAEEEKLVGYFNIFTPIRDYHNVRLNKDEIDNIFKGMKKLCKNEDGKRYVLEFQYNGLNVIIMPDTLKNSVIEHVIYRKKWWGLRKIK